MFKIEIEKKLNYLQIKKTTRKRNSKAATKIKRE